MKLEPVQELEREGIVRLPELLAPTALSQLQRAFEAQLRCLRWNNFDGFEKTERYRHLVKDVLAIDQGFLDLALHPRVTSVLRAYLGARFELVEAKGWKSIPTRRDFHGWHADAWYDQNLVSHIPRELKLAVFLTDVRSGGFLYIQRSHRREHPRIVQNREIDGRARGRIVELSGKAGTAFLFDTSGVHRQAVPILEPRNAVFFAYHDPDIPLQREDLDDYRYHPLLLNAAFLGNLGADDRRILGFGNKRNHVPAFERQKRYAQMRAIIDVMLDQKLLVDDLMSRIAARFRRAITAEVLRAQVPPAVRDLVGIARRPTRANERAIFGPFAREEREPVPDAASFEDALEGYVDVDSRRRVESDRSQ